MGNVLIQTTFYQRAETLKEEGGQFMFDFDGDEIFHVDLQKSETIWRLPLFSKFASFEAQGALQNIAVGKQNMEIMMQRSNRSQGTIGNNPATARPLPAPLRPLLGPAAPQPVGSSRGQSAQLPACPGCAPSCVRGPPGWQWGTKGPLWGRKPWHHLGAVKLG